MNKVVKNNSVVKKSNKQPLRKLSKSYSFDKNVSKVKWQHTDLGLVGSCFGVIVSILFIILIIRTLLVPSSPILTFETFLQILQGTPDFVPVFSIIDLTIVADWGVFEFLKDFINLFTGSIEFLLSIVDVIHHCLDFIFYYLTVLFNFTI